MEPTRWPGDRARANAYAAACRAPYSIRAEPRRMSPICLWILTGMRRSWSAGFLEGGEAARPSGIELSLLFGVAHNDCRPARRIFPLWVFLDWLLSGPWGSRSSRLRRRLAVHGPADAVRGGSYCAGARRAAARTGRRLTWSATPKILPRRRHLAGCVAGQFTRHDSTAFRKHCSGPHE